MMPEMEANTFYISVLCLSSTTLLVALLALWFAWRGMRASEHNAYDIQAPWFKDYKFRIKMEDDKKY